MPDTKLEKSQILEEIVRFSSRNISDIPVDEFHELARLTEVIHESQNLVAIYTGPDKPVQPLINHMKRRFAEFGIGGSAVHVQDYTDKFGTPQQNLVVELSKGNNGEIVAISGHSDTVGADMGIFSTSPDSGKLYVGRMELKNTQNGEPSVYGFGMCDMKNIFGVVMQIAKESHLAGTPQLYVQERSWINGVDAGVWGKYKSWLEQNLAEGKITDVLSKSKNRLVLAVTSGEETAGHEGMKKALEYNLAGVNNADLWIIPEPSKGLVDTHKGYAATKIEIGKNAVVSDVTYNPNEQALRLVDVLRRRHSEKRLVKPHYIEDDRLGLPTHNVGIIRGFMDDLKEEYFEVRFTGKGGHSSKPIDGGHPIECAAYFYNALKKIYGNNLELVLLNGGRDRNVIPVNVDLGIKVNNKGYNAGFFGRMLDFATLALDDFKECGMEIAANNCSGLDEALSSMARHDRIKVSTASLERNQRKFQPAIIENDYRIVPGQVPDSLAESVQEIAGSLGIDAKVTLIRDSYPFPSRYLLLNRELQNRLLAVMGQSKCEGANFSTEAGTLASILPNVVPIVMSTTSIDQAHKQEKEYVTLNALKEQVRIFSEMLPALLNSPIKSPHGSARITASGTELFISGMRKEYKIPEKEIREHLGWFRDWGVFAVIQPDKTYTGSRNNLKKIEACISDFSRFLGIYPVLVLNGTEEFVRNNFSRQAFRYEVITPGREFNTRFIATATQAIRRGEIPIVVNDSSDDHYAFANRVVNALKPLKYVVLTPKVIYDSGGSFVPRIEFNKLLTEPVFGEPLSTNDFVAKIKVNTLRADSYGLLQRAYNHLVSFGDKKTAKRRSVQIASLDSLMGELFSVAGRGTILRLGYEIVESDSFSSVDMPRLKELLEDIYGGTINPTYFKRRGAQVRKIFIEEDYDGVAVLATPSNAQLELNRKILHIDKIGVRDDFWRQHLPEALMERVFSTADMIYWRDFQGSKIREWSSRLLDYARRKDRWGSTDTFQHSTGREMDVYFIGFNPHSQKDAQARALLNSEISSMPHSFHYR